MDVITENMDKIDAALSSHELDTNNPHDVTKAQVGLSNVDNTSDLDKPISSLTQTALNLKADDLDLTTHTNNTSNPHDVTKTQIGLSNVDNTSDLDKPISTATQTALNLKANDLALTTHTSNTDNPHGVTKAQVGLANVVNVDTTTTANINDSPDKRFVSDADKTLLGNTSGINTGDETNETIKTKLGIDLSNKVDKVDGKGLSANDFTAVLKAKLDGIAENANNYTLPIASTDTLGGVKVDGTTVTIANGVISAPGADGQDGMSAYASAQAGGYTDTEANFYADLAAMQGLAAELEALL